MGGWMPGGFDLNGGDRSFAFGGACACDAWRSAVTRRA